MECNGATLRLVEARGTKAEQEEVATAAAAAKNTMLRLENISWTVETKVYAQWIERQSFCAVASSVQYDDGALVAKFNRIDDRCDGLFSWRIVIWVAVDQESFFLPYV